MFDAPIDAWYVWLGLAVASVAVFGVVTSLPTAPPPDAPGVAETVDRVATADYDTTAVHAVDATEVRLGPRRIGLGNDAGTTHATLAYPVVPTRPGTSLGRILRGTPPADAFPSPAAFDHAVTAAEERPPRWRPAGDALVVRHLSWHGREITLVGTMPENGRNRRVAAAAGNRTSGGTDR